MTEKKSNFEEVAIPPQDGLSNVSRRKFLSYAALSASAVAAVSCQKDGLKQNDLSYVSGVAAPNGTMTSVNLGSGDIGILNYAYALEQLEAAFYTMVLQTPYAGISNLEKTVLASVRDHEIAHREFFKNAIGTSAIGALQVDFSSIDFSSRDSVLMTAKAFEDLGVSAYNGAGDLLQSATYLLLAGKIVSVEARHAATIRDLISYGSFADSTVIDANGLDVVRRPPAVLAIAGAYIKTKIIYNNLPTS